METFGENFRGGGGPAMCPLCDTHLDNQALSLQCPVIKNEVGGKSDIKEVFEDHIKLESVETIMKIMKIRENLITN